MSEETIQQEPQDSSSAASSVPASPESSPSVDVSLSTAESAFLSAARSLLLERKRFADAFGFNQFDGRRELFKVLGYPETLTVSDYRNRFSRGGIARRIVTAAPKAMQWPKVQIIEKESPKTETALESAWKGLWKRLNVGSVLKRADIQAGILEYSVIFIGVKEKGTIGHVNILETEMPRLTGPDDVVYLRPLSQDMARIESYVGDDKSDATDDPRFGLPKFYDITISGIRRAGLSGLGGSVGGVANNASRRVHWSRVIHVTHEPLDNEVFSTPELSAVWNYLVDLDKLVGGGSESFWKQAIQRVLFDLDKDIGPDGIGSNAATASLTSTDPTKIAAFNEEKARLKEQLEEMVNNLRVHAFTRGVTPHVLATVPPDFAANVDVILKLISATVEQPQHKLFGTQAGKLASAGQDKNTADDYNANRQEDFGTSLMRQFVDRLILYNGLPAPKTDYEVNWPVTDELSEEKKAAVAGVLAAANAAQKKADGTIIYTSDEIRDDLYGKDPLPKPEPVEPPTVPAVPSDPNAPPSNAPADPATLPNATIPAPADAVATPG